MKFDYLTMKISPMMSKGYRIAEFEDIEVFHGKMKNFTNDTIECTDHTFFRLSEKQKKEFTCDALKSFLLNEVPLKVGIQVNKNYAVYYKYPNNRIIKIVASLKPNVVRIITFMILDKEQLPR